MAGQAMKEGDTILVLLAAAGLPFGAGPHRCPGEALACAIADAAAEPASLRYRVSQNMRMPE